MVNDTDKNGPSRLDKHLSILGLGDKLDEKELAAERKVMAEMTPKKLTFPREQASAARAEAGGVTRWLQEFGAKWQLGVAALGAAALAVVLYQNQSGPDGAYTIKGGGSVALFYEQDGQVKAWTKGTELKEGAKVRAEVLATRPSVAFWGVTAKGAKLLNEPAWVLENRLELKPGDKKFFPGSLELSGPSESETLVVSLCPEGYVSLTAPETPELLAKLLVFYATDTLSDCKTERFQLRP